VEPAIGSGAPVGNSGGLDALGLCAGEAVRFRGHSGGHWQPAVVARRERDGSVGLVDGDGAARSLPPERIEVRCVGPRRGRGWEPLVARAHRARPAPETTRTAGAAVIEAANGAGQQLSLF
jgi:hypothetical protein